MLSIKKLLDYERPPATEKPDSHLRLAHLLLQGIGLHAVEADATECQRFRTDLQRLSTRLDAKPLDADVLPLAGEAIQTIEEYNRGLAEFLKRQGIEYHAMVGMLARTVETLAAGCNQAVARLKEIEQNLEKAAALDDVHDLRMQLSACLEGLKDERQRQQDHADRIVSLKAQVVDVSKRAAVCAREPEQEQLDPCTGLPTRAAAERMIGELQQKGAPWYAVLFVVDRVQLVNHRFGYAVGDDLLLTFAQHIAQKLRPEDHCFRWNGPALLALIRRSQPAQAVRLDVQRLIPGKTERTFNVGSRSVLIPLSATWTVVPMGDAQDQEEVVAMLNAFLAARAPEPRSDN